MKRTYLLLLFLLLALPGYGQRTGLELKSDYNSNNELVITAQKTALGTHYLEIHFTELTNSNFHQRVFRRTLKNGGEVLKIGAVTRESYPTVRYRYTYWRANPDAKPDTAFVYRLPYSTQSERQVDSLYLIRGSRRQNNIDWHAMQFKTQPGDTIYAVRAGLVIETTRADEENRVESLSTGRITFDRNVNQILIEHEDGTYADYTVLDTMFVRSSDRVWPDTPLGITGTYDDNIYQTRLSIYYMRIAPKNSADETTSFLYHYLRPVFATAAGETKLTMHRYYRPVAPVELITREMPRREARKYQGQ